jgi:hypothetical protein
MVATCRRDWCMAAKEQCASASSDRALGLGSPRSLRLASAR